MNKRIETTSIVILVAGIISLAAFLVLRGEKGDNNGEREQIFQPLTQEQLDAFIASSTAISNTSLLTKEEEARLIASSTAQSDKSLLTPEEVKGLEKNSQVPNR